MMMSKEASENLGSFNGFLDKASAEISADSQAVLSEQEVEAFLTKSGTEAGKLIEKIYANPQGITGVMANTPLESFTGIVEEKREQGVFNLGREHVGLLNRDSSGYSVLRRVSDHVHRSVKKNEAQEVLAKIIGEGVNCYRLLYQGAYPLSQRVMEEYDSSLAASIPSKTGRGWGRRSA